MLELHANYGLLTIIARLDVRNGKRHYLCRCACGTPFRIVRGDRLVSGKTASCGCARAKRNGHSSSPTYKTWAAMRRRCSDPKHPHYADYGGRGIRVCDRWNDPHRGFEAFVEDMGWRPEGKTLDRRDVNGMYEKSNCKWATIIEQRWNRRDMRRELIDELNAENAYWDEQERLRAAADEVIPF